MKKKLQEAARRRSAAMASKPTKDMVKYLEILLNDCGYCTSRLQRNDYLSNVVGREIHHLDELTFDEAHAEISKLKIQRAELER